MVAVIVVSICDVLLLMCAFRLRKIWREEDSD